MNYTLKEIARICGGKLTGADIRVGSVMTDSRHSHNTDDAPLFVAIGGQNHDGHRFIADLYRRGVRAFLIERDVDASLYPEAGFVKVKGSLRALQALASDYRSCFRGTMVAITGSSGKTTVKEWIAQLAPEGMRMFRSPRSYNSQLGVPLSILMMQGDEDVALIEAGISRPGEMDRLAGIIRPDIGIFTNLGEEHDENFDSQEQKVSEKAMLFSTCTKIIYSGRYPLVKEILEAKIPSAALYDSTRFTGDTAGVFDDGASQENAALALAFYDALGAGAGAVRARLAGLHPIAMRIDIREGLGGSLILSDRSNTDINSLGIALDYMKGIAGERRRMLILSDILYSSLPDFDLYEKVAAMVSAAGIDYLVGVGERIKTYGSMFDCRREFYPTAEDFLKKLNQDKIAGMAILAKGNETADFQKILHQLERKSHTTVLEINLDAMVHNLNHFRSLAGEGTRIMAMVKASGYGNGNYEVANMLHGQGVDYLAVAFADEGVRLREQGITMPIVVLNADADSFDLMIANRLEPEIYSFTSLATFVSAVKESYESGYPIHIKLDTGMHRLGFAPGDVPQLIEMLGREQPAVVVRSLFSHLAAADMPSEDDFTRAQIAAFDRLSTEIINALPYRPLRHIANSAAMERFPAAKFDMCRVGIGLYGVSSVDRNALKPVSRLTTRIVQIKELDETETVGYGRAGKLTAPRRVATIPVGYADGMDRRLGEGRWRLLVKGKPVPTLGRICMDSCMIDITGVDACEGDEVTVFGSTAGNTIEDMAAVLDTIPYEIMTSIAERVKRIYTKER